MTPWKTRALKKNHSWSQKSWLQEESEIPRRIPERAEAGLQKELSIPLLIPGRGADPRKLLISRKGGPPEAPYLRERCWPPKAADLQERCRSPDGANPEESLKNYLSQGELLILGSVCWPKKKLLVHQESFWSRDCWELQEESDPYEEGRANSMEEL